MLGQAPATKNNVCEDKQYDHCQCQNKVYETRQELKYGAIHIILHQHSCRSTGMCRNTCHNGERQRWGSSSSLSPKAEQPVCEKFQNSWGHKHCLKIHSSSPSGRTEAKHSLRSLTKLHLRLRKMKNPIISPSGYSSLQLLLQRQLTWIYQIQLKIANKVSTVTHSSAFANHLHG